MASTLYFAPTYFAPSYFATPMPDLLPPPPGTGTPYDDLRAYGAILNLLRETQVFGTIRFGRTLETLPIGVQGTSLALLVPDGWEELDEFDPASILRRVSFRIELLVRDDDPLKRFERLERLAASARLAVCGSDLDGGCIPALTRVSRGRHDQRALHPEGVLRLEGEFSYLIGSVTPGEASS